MKPNRPTSKPISLPSFWPSLKIAVAFLAVALSILAIPKAHAANDSDLHANVELISAQTDLKPNSVQDLALVVRPMPGWYTYWRNPGEVGKPTTINWTLPQGVNVGEPEWPLPIRKTEDGGISYAFPDEHILPIGIAISDQLDFNLTEHRFVADVSWLACKDICIPESTQVSLSLPVANASTRNESRRSANAERIELAKSLIPPLNRNIPANFQIDQTGNVKLINIEVSHQNLPALTQKPNALIGTQGIVNEQLEASITTTESSLLIQFEADPYLDSTPEHFPLILTGFDEQHVSSSAIELHVEVSGDPLNAIDEATAPQSQSSHAGAPVSIATAILFAFLGGLILNAMPCVFPVLSLKVIGLVQSNVGGDPVDLKKHRHQHGIAYTAGVVVSFVAIALMLILLRGLGEQIGWGFQLQSPAFIAALAIIIFVLGLSLSGVIEIGSSLQNIGNQAPDSQSDQHWYGAFWTGVLATVVATPCTAPFMGTAMGFALSQPVIVTLIVFVAMALGLASPFLAIAFIPKLADLMPRPGMWMVRLKEFLAFPLYLTAVWLVWVFARQAGTNAAALLLVALVCAAMTSWAWQIRFNSNYKALWTSLSGVMLAATIYTTYVACVQVAIAPAEPSSSTVKATNQTSIAYSQDVLQTALERGDTVLVNMTADWCITCKVNEKVALKSPTVQSVLQEDDVTYIKGDWTNSDPTITRYLDSFGRNGVPLYVVYRPGAQPQILPQILTPSSVVAALRD